MWLYMIRTVDEWRFSRRKYSKTFEKLSDDCDKALRQIDERMYAKEFEGNYDKIFNFNCPDDSLWNFFLQETVYGKGDR